jgi:hypothetical protein
MHSVLEKAMNRFNFSYIIWTMLMTVNNSLIVYNQLNPTNQKNYVEFLKEISVNLSPITSVTNNEGPNFPNSE